MALAQRAGDVLDRRDRLRGDHGGDRRRARHRFRQAGAAGCSADRRGPTASRETAHPRAREERLCPSTTTPPPRHGGDDARPFGSLAQRIGRGRRPPARADLSESAARLLGADDGRRDRLGDDELDVTAATTPSLPTRRRRRSPSADEPAPTSRPRTRPTDDAVDEAPATETPRRTEAAAVEVDEDEDPVETLRRELRTQFGDWYVVHSYAGYENKVKTNLESRIQSLDMEDYIFQVEVPTEEVVEIKNGKRQQVQRKVFPGYILVRMDLNDESWGAVRNTPGVTGFVGATSRPSPLTLDEVVKILAPATQKAAAVARAARPAPPAARSRRSRPSTTRSASRSPSWTARSPPCRRRSARSTRCTRSCTCSCRSSAARRPVELSFSQVSKI